MLHTMLHDVTARVATITLQAPYKDGEPEIGAVCNPPRR
jgi:hypothetical protein